MQRFKEAMLFVFLWILPLSSLQAEVVNSQTVNSSFIESLFVYEGILSFSSSRVMPSSAKMVFTIKRGSCVVYKEKHDSIAIGELGEFSVVVGRGVRLDDTLNTEDKIFAVSGNIRCADNSDIEASGLDQKLYINVDGVDLDPPVEIVKVPYAISAKSSENAVKLGGKMSQDFLQASESVNQALVDSWFQSVVMSDLLSGNYISNSSNSAKTLSMTLPIEKGGTGATSAADAANAILPSQAGASGKYLTTNGSALSWASLPANSTTVVTAATPLSVAPSANGYYVTLPKASGAVSGYLDAADWNNFNQKQAGSNALSALSSMTGIGFIQRLAGGSYTASTATDLAEPGALVLRDGNGGASLSSMKLGGSAVGAGTVMLQVPTAFTSYSLTLPNMVGIDGQILSAGSNGSLKWVNESEFVKSSEVQYGKALVGKFKSVSSGTVVDFADANLQSIEGGCKSIELKNMVSGGTYQLVVKPIFGESMESTCSFNAPKPVSGTYSIKSNPVNLTKSPGKEILFSFSVMGDNIYVTSVDGY